MGEVTNNTRTAIYIGSTAKVDTTNEATAKKDFAADTYTRITGVKEIGGETGVKAEVLTAKVVGDDPFVRKRRGSRDAGSVNLVAYYNADDAGQIAVVAAAESLSDNPNNFKIILDDAPAGGTPTTIYFRGLVVSAVTTLSDADALVELSFEIALDGQRYTVPASKAAPAE